MKKHKFKYTAGRALRHIVLALWCATTAFPILWTLMVSFKDNSQIFTAPFAWPNPVISSNFSDIFAKLNIPRGFLNSIIYSFFTVLIVCILSAMVGFYLSKCVRRKGGFLYTYFILGMMIPVQAIAIPMFVHIKNFNLINTSPGIIITYVVIELAFAIFIMAGFISRSVPDSIIEAASIDGCNVFGVFVRMVLPLAKSGIATVGTFVFLHVWNEFFFALILLAKPELISLNLTTYKLRGQYSSDYGLLAAGVVILAVPALIIYALFQEQVVKGLTAGAVKE